MIRLPPRLKTGWGFSLFKLVSLFAMIRLLKQDVHGHYRIFTGAASALWRVENPYGTDFGTGVGFWFYSPTCGMLFFQPFNWLPEWAGLTLYMVLSWAVFVLGARAFVAYASRTALLRDAFTPSILNLFWTALAPQMMLAILASKLEILMAGVLLLAVTWIGGKAGSEADSGPGSARRLALATCVLALLLNWKFQPLPTVGLISLGWILIRRSVRFPLGIGLWLAFWFLLPFAFLRWDFLVAIHRDWRATLGVQIERDWKLFDHVFTFLRQGLGADLELGTAQRISVVVGAGMAATLAAWIARARKRLAGEELFAGMLFLALVLGAAFTTAFSPLNQNNAAVLYTPILILGLGAFARSSGGWRKGLRAGLILAVGLMMFAYSDLLPRALSAWFRAAAIKPVATLALACVIAAYFFSRQWLEDSSSSSDQREGLETT